MNNYANSFTINLYTKWLKTAFVALQCLKLSYHGLSAVSIEMLRWWVIKKLQNSLTVEYLQSCYISTWFVQNSFKKPFCYNKRKNLMMGEGNFQGGLFLHTALLHCYLYVYATKHLKMFYDIRKEDCSWLIFA